VAFRKLRPDAVVPSRATTDSAALDLRYCGDGPRLIAPQRRLLLSTGLSVEIPKGYEGQVRPRSGLALAHGITVLNSPGTIDADYRGELMVLLVNLGTERWTANPGDRIAQLVIARISTPSKVVEASTLSETQRASGGFGSTGR
jgi:dUTP pyrophosphatase